MSLGSLLATTFSLFDLTPPTSSKRLYFRLDSSDGPVEGSVEQQVVVDHDELVVHAGLGVRVFPHLDAGVRQVLHVAALRPQGLVVGDDLHVDACRVEGVQDAGQPAVGDGVEGHLRHGRLRSSTGRRIAGT